MKTATIILSALAAISLSFGDIILLQDFPYSGYSGDGNINTYGIVNLLQTNGIDDVTQIDMETWHARNGEAWMIEEIANNNNRNIFGYYDLGNPNEGYEIFSGSMNDGNTNGPDPYINPPISQTGIRMTFAENPTRIGFYCAANGAYNNVMFTETNRNIGNNPQVAVFQCNKDQHSYILAWEDLWLETGSDGDFNDMVLKLTLANSYSPYDDQYLLNRVAKRFLPHPSINPPPATVPESSTVVLVGIGLLFIIAQVYYRKKTTA